MDYKTEKKVKDAYDTGKYGHKLKICRKYIDMLNGDNFTKESLEETHNFSVDTYKELSVEEPIIAIKRVIILLILCQEVWHVRHIFKCWCILQCLNI